MASTYGWSSTGRKARWRGSADSARRGRSASCCPGTAIAAAAELLDANERYIRDFMAAASAATTKDEGVATMTRAYPDLELPVILDFGMQAAVEGRSYPDIMRAYLDAGA